MKAQRPQMSQPGPNTSEANKTWTFLSVDESGSQNLGWKCGFHAKRIFPDWLKDRPKFVSINIEEDMY